MTENTNTYPHDEITKVDDIYTRIAALPKDVQTTMMAILHGYLIGYEIGTHNPPSA